MAIMGRPTRPDATAPRSSTAAKLVAGALHHSVSHEAVGANVRASVAAERALQAGEEVEDTLWMGSHRFLGQDIRRELQHCRSSRMRLHSSHKTKAANNSSTCESYQTRQIQIIARHFSQK